MTQDENSSAGYPAPCSHVPGNNVTLREAAQALLDAQKAGQRHVGYRLDLWSALEATIEAEEHL